MSEQPNRICVNEREVAAKVIDGEAIIINLTKGTYYSLEGVGGAAWSMLAAGHSLDEAAQTLAKHYSVDQASAGRISARWLMNCSSMSWSLPVMPQLPRPMPRSNCPMCRRTSPRR